MGSDAEFRDGVSPLETLGIRVCHKTIQRVSEAVGAQAAAQQHGALATVQAPEQAPANAPDLLVIERWHAHPTAREKRRTQKRRTRQWLARMQSGRGAALPTGQFQTRRHL